MLLSLFCSLTPVLSFCLLSVVAPLYFYVISSLFLSLFSLSPPPLLTFPLFPFSYLLTTFLLPLSSVLSLSFSYLSVVFFLIVHLIYFFFFCLLLSLSLTFPLPFSQFPSFSVTLFYLIFTPNLSCPQFFLSPLSSLLYTLSLNSVFLFLVYIFCVPLFSFFLPTLFCCILFLHYFLPFIIQDHPVKVNNFLSDTLGEATLSLQHTRGTTEGPSGSTQLGIRLFARFARNAS